MRHLFDKTAYRRRSSSALAVRHSSKVISVASLLREGVLNGALAKLLELPDKNSQGLSRCRREIKFAAPLTSPDSSTVMSTGSINFKPSRSIMPFLNA
jgi:hypothetical protein